MLWPKRYQSFFLGIIITSVMWSVILYLYFSLSDTFAHYGTSERTVKWKLRPRLQNIHKSEERNTYTNSKSIEHLKYKNTAYFPPKELNLINSNEKDDEIQISELGKYSDKDKALDHDEIPENVGEIRNPTDRKIKDDGYKSHAFNVLISNRLGYHRLLPDTRHHLCQNQSYSTDLPVASIVICFYNEALSTLLRTVYSVLDRTPSHLLHEIILVDDYSEDDDLKNLNKYLIKKSLNKVRVIRTPERAGLIRARMFGARHAMGEVLVFLDSHCEVNVHWLEPLLDRIHANRTNVVCPVIDIINADTFEYSGSPIVRGGFNWGLHFKWDSVPPSLLEKEIDYIKPIRSPTMAGGLFAMDRKYFQELGEYDNGMDIWGGENLEISFRIWMCGGSLEIIPCSRVGHVFRKRRPYGSPKGEDTMLHNSLRVAHVWMDDYKKYYFEQRSDVANKEYGDISGRIALRKKLQCKSFEWYLKNIYPDLSPPVPQSEREKLKKLEYEKSKNKLQVNYRRQVPKVTAIFQIQLANSDLCIESEDDITKKSSLLILQKCLHIKRQLWYETKKKDLRLAELLCLDAGTKHPILAKCHEMGGSQEWKLYSRNAKNIPIYNTAAGLCLGVKSPVIMEHITMEICSSAEARRWNLIKKPL